LGIVPKLARSPKNRPVPNRQSGGANPAHAGRV